MIINKYNKNLDKISQIIEKNFFLKKKKIRNNNLILLFIMN